MHNPDPLAVERRRSDLAKRLVRQLAAAVNDRQLDAIDDLVASTYRHCAPGHPLTLEELKDLNRALYAGFPDIRWHILELVAEGDVVVAFWRMSGTHRGRFMGRPASGTPVSVTGVNSYRITEGKIAEDTPHWAFSALLDQLTPLA